MQLQCLEQCGLLVKEPGSNAEDPGSSPRGSPDRIFFSFFSESLTLINDT